MFAFANGGKFGVMGEAGPEAVMPLTRRSDGSLGVRADGIGGGSPVVVNVINNSNARATTQQRQTEQGTTIDVMIDELVAQKLGQQGTASNQALTAFNNRQLVAR
jgi:phage-related minor tail protein